jgi:hypothetical protein
LLHLLAFSEKNRILFFKMKNWHHWFLSILASTSSDHDSSRQRRQTSGFFFDHFDPSTSTDLSSIASSNTSSTSSVTQSTPSQASATMSSSLSDPKSTLSYKLILQLFTLLVSSSMFEVSLSFLVSLFLIFKPKLGG